MNILDAETSIQRELERAESKFPSFPTDPIHAAAILQEEAGELIQAALQFTYEGGSFDAMKKEAVQVGAMALRFLVNIDSMRVRPSEQVERWPGIVQQAIKAGPQADIAPVDSPKVWTDTDVRNANMNEGY